MSSIAVLASATGAGVITLAAPITATNRTITLPDATGTMATAESTLAQFNATGAAPVYACRAWVNFNGTGTVAIRASGNVSSITDNGAGDYTVNFTTAMSDANYSASIANGNLDGSGGYNRSNNLAAQTSSSLRVGTLNTNASAYLDSAVVTVAIFR